MQCAHRTAHVRLPVWIFCALLAFVIPGCGGGGGGGGDGMVSTPMSGDALSAAPETMSRISNPSTVSDVCLPPAPGSIAVSYTVVVLDPAFDPNLTAIGHANLNELGHVAFTSGGQARFYDGSSVRNLGTLGGAQSAAAGLNSSDQVTGFSTNAAGARHAFLWTPTGGMLDLGAPAGQESLGEAINEAGHVSGMILAFPSNRPFLWTSQTGRVTQQDSAAVFGFTTASFINASDAIVGEASTPQSADAKQAYLWTQANGVQALGSLGGRSSSAQDLNDADQVVGSAEAPAMTPATRALHAFLWTAQTGILDLGTLGGDSSNALAINQSGQIVGSAQNTAGSSHAFLRSPGDTALQDLGTLGGAASLARDINDDGVVVGSAQTASGSTHAFIWTSADGMVDLNTLETGKPAGVELRAGVAVSDSGFILALSSQGLVLLKPACSTGGLGSVTGTVRFQSPAGALASNPSLAAPASFNSVVRNTGNAAQPTGHTMLRMDAFNFTATAYDQLVVQDGRAQYQGQGAVNGSSGFFFRITEIDSGQPGGRGDAVQIRVWHLEAGTQSEVVDYDTGEMPLPTDNGNIVVHAR